MIIIVKKNVTLLLILSVLVSVVVSAEDPPATSPGKVQVCATCHGQNGIATISTYPNLAGQNRDYLIAALKAYKNLERNGGLAGVMQQQAAALTDDDIAEIADYYSTLK